jgi:hypothetical protein
MLKLVLLSAVSKRRLALAWWLAAEPWCWRLAQ